MNLSIHETHVTYPEPSTRFIIEEYTHCGYQIIAITDTQKEAYDIYDRLNNQEAEYV